MIQNFPTIHAERDRYFERFCARFENYDFDVQQEMCRSLPKIRVLNPALHELISLLYEKAMEVTSVDRDCELYDAMREKLIEYIEFKKQANTDQKSLSQLDIWTQSLYESKNEEEAREFLNASDQIQDLLWLASVVSTQELPEEETKLGQAIDKVLLLLPHFLKGTSIDPDLGMQIDHLLRSINTFYLSGQYKSTLDEIEKIKLLIQR